MSRLDWFERAACKDMDTNDFFFDPGETERAKAARRVCNGCPVRDDCLQYAIDLHVTSGMYGGTTEHERRKIRRERTRHAECAWCGQTFSWLRKSSGGSNPVTCSPECSRQRRRYMQNQANKRRLHARKEHAYEPQPEYRQASSASGGC